MDHFRSGLLAGPTAGFAPRTLPGGNPDGKQTTKDASPRPCFDFLLVCGLAFRAGFRDAASRMHGASIDRRSPDPLAILTWNRHGSKGFRIICAQEVAMIRKLKSGEYRLYSRKVDPRTGKRRNLGTFKSREAAEKHEREVQYFKRH
jgi:hypothetical protein